MSLYWAVWYRTYSSSFICVSENNSLDYWSAGSSIYIIYINHKIWYILRSLKSRTGNLKLKLALYLNPGVTLVSKTTNNKICAWLAFQSFLLIDCIHGNNTSGTWFCNEHKKFLWSIFWHLHQKLSNLKTEKSLQMGTWVHIFINKAIMISQIIT